MYCAKTAVEKEADSSDLPSCCHRTKYVVEFRRYIREVTIITHEEHTLVEQEYHCDDTHGEPGTIYQEEEDGTWDEIESVEEVLTKWSKRQEAEDRIQSHLALFRAGAGDIPSGWQVSYNQPNHRFEITNGVVSYYSYTEEGLEEWIKEMITVSFIEESFIQAVADGDSLAKVAYTDWIKEQGREEELAIS